MPPYPSYPDTKLERILPERGELIEDPVEQLRTMDQVAHHVGEVGLGHMRPGWLGYKVVTANVYRAMIAGEFDFPEKFEITIPEFADLGYEMTRRHIEGRRDLIAPHWRVPMYSKDLRASGDGVNMWGFWRGHIPDLTKVLLITDTEDKHRDDYDKIDNVLRRSIEPVMAEISVAPTIIGRIGVRVAMQDVYHLRASQWHEFKRLQALGWNEETARDAVIPGVYRFDRLRSLAQAAGDFTMRIAGAYRNDPGIVNEAA